MVAVEWDESYSVKVSELDRQHRKLFDMISELSDAMRARQGSQALSGILGGMKDYAKEHFQREEELFEEHLYPERVAHSREHQTFIRKVFSFHQDLEEGRMMLSIEVLDYLRNWLVDHIATVDRKYSDFFREKGLS